MKAFDIEWDLEDDVEDYNIDDYDLPTEVDIPDWVIEDCLDETEMVDEIGDYLSDEYGFCVIEFGLER